LGDPDTDGRTLFKYYLNKQIARIGLDSSGLM